VNSAISTKNFSPPGKVRAVEVTPYGLLLSFGDERLRVEVLRHDLLRLKISQGQVFDEEPTHAVVQVPEGRVKFEAGRSNGEITLVTEALKLVIHREPFSMACYRTDGSVIFEDAVDETGKPIGYLQLNDTFVITRKMHPHDAIYGLGEKTGGFDRRGRRFVLWNTDILQDDVLRQNRLFETDLTQHGKSTSYDPYYSSTPFFYHCRASEQPVAMAGFFIDNAFKARFEFDHPHHYRYQFEGGQYTEYVFAGPDMPGILGAYTELTGRMAPPPLWSLGVHQCRFHDYTQDEVLRLGKEYRERDIPCDVLWLDIGHMSGFRVFTWDPKKFPDAARMVAALREQKFRVVAIVDPGIKQEPGYPVFEEGYAKNLFCKTESGNLFVGQVWPGRTVFPDLSRAEVRTWWGELNARHASVGLAGIWNDMNEPTTGDVPPFAMRFDRDGENHPHERFHNQYALLMAMATHEGLKAARPTERPFILTRAGFAGIQRYAAQWTGDNYSEWSHLRMSIAMSTGMGISGQAFVGSDMPGFMGRPTAELAVRWTQYGALTPFCRYHNTMGEADQYPWSFGDGVARRSREALRMRYRLLPYLYSVFMEASRTGAPVMRPLVFHYQQDRQARETDDIFLLGEALLVAPITEAGQTSRHVYLPEGQWIDFATGEMFEGTQFITASAPLDHCPVFVRGGAVVPTHAEAPNSTMEHQPDCIELNLLAPNRDGEFVSELWEDDGVSTAHERGAYLHTTFTVKRAGKKLALEAKVDGKGFAGFKRRSFRLVLRGATVVTLRLNGVELVEQSFKAGIMEFENAGVGFLLEMTLA
jgi:alpha-glucosidase